MQRKRYIDILRVISMFAVVADHVIKIAINRYETTLADGIISNLLYYLSLFAVPCFLMISGSFLLNPNKQIKREKYYKKYIKKYILVILIFGTVFSIIENFFSTRTISIKLLISSILDTLQGNSWEHMWYMYTLVGLILVLPVLRCISKNLLGDNIYFFLFVSITFISVLPVIKRYTGFELGVSIPISTIWPIYMLIGYWIDSETIKIPKYISIIIIGVIFILYVLFSIANAKMGADLSGLIQYASPLTLMYSVSIFSLNNHCDKEVCSGRIIKWLSEMSFGVYLVHMFYINIVYKVFDFDPFIYNTVLGFSAIYLFVLGLSIISVWVMKKIPFLRSLL